MQATRFEFRYRLVLMIVLFCVGFSCNAWKQPSVAEILSHHVIHSHQTPDRPLALRAIILLAACLIAIGGGIRAWGSAYLQLDTVYSHSVQSNQLVCCGPYRFLRNPLYLGNVFLSVGIAAMAVPIGALIIVGGMTVLAVRLVLREESELRKELGAAYQQYCDKVPRWFPVFRPTIPKMSCPSDWKGALIGETFIWISFFATVVLAVTLKQAIFYVLLISSLPLYGLIEYLAKRPSQMRISS